jgi:hypothetical protein
MLPKPLLWIQIRIRKDPKLFAGSGFGIRIYGSRSGSLSGTRFEPYKKSSKNSINEVVAY